MTITSPHLLPRRLYALLLRHVYLHLGSWPRIVEMMYWPLVNLASWGFVSLYVTKKFAHVETLGSTFVAGVVMTEMFIRPTSTMLMLFIEEMWSRNLGHLFASPIRMREYALGLMGITLLRSAIALTPAIIIAKYLFGFSLLGLGWPMAGFIGILAIDGCLFGLCIVALLLRFGMASEWLAWMATWLLIPFFAPYYPVSVLPEVFQYVSYALPPTYVFESMKSLINDGTLQAENLLIALGLTMLYTALAATLLHRAYQSARQRGGLLQAGE